MKRAGSLRPLRWSMAVALALLMTAVSTAWGQTRREVGPSRQLALPSDAARVAGDNDTIEIAPGVYEDCAIWRANGLTIRAIGGEVHIRGKACAGKGLWVFEGDRTTVEGIRFSDAAVPDRNGAGIRLTRGSLTVRNSTFVNNENGILTGAGRGETVLIENSRFEGNGKCEPQCAHGIYVGEVDRLVVHNSVFRGQKIGHHIKSRARATEVLDCRIEDGPDGTASYLIEAPWGGNVTIVGNVLQKGPRSDNPSVAIAIGFEGVKHATPAIVIERNDFASDLPEMTAFVRNMTTTPARLIANRLCGKVQPLDGPGTLEGEQPCRRP